MRDVAIITDSNSGITQKQAQEAQIHVLPMPIMLDGDLFFEGINLTQAEFYQKLLTEDVEVSTSQPSVGATTHLWDELLEEYREIVHIPMSSGLSSAYETKEYLSREYGGRVQVVNNQRISVTLRQSVMDAVTLAQNGWGAARIKEHLEREKFCSSIYIMLSMLKYLKRGGRITPAAAAIGSLLRISPVLQIQGEKLDSYAKARSVKQAREIMIEAMRRDFASRFQGFSDPDHMWLQMAYTYDQQAALDFKAEVERAFPGFDIHMDPLPLSVSCHIGPGALAISCAKKLDCL
ncbi:MAG: DegV family protein [Oscillospiraceae bacterium]|nr:DegV family protein [Oscillospiraceae bacterium]